MSMIGGQTRETKSQAEASRRFDFVLDGLAAMWRDRSGRFSALRLAAFVLALAPALWLATALALGAAGARPIETALDVTGLWTIRFLILTLCVTPLRRIFGWTRLSKLRRMLGLTAAAYAGLHFLLFLTHQNFDLIRAATEIALRIYLTIGFLALAGLAALSVTSTDRWIRSLGPRWNRLHQLVYPITGVALLHFMMQAKFDVQDAVFYVGLFGLLIAYRTLARRRIALTPLTLALLAAAAIPLTMALEIGWHAVATSAEIEAIWAMNFAFSYGWAPAWQVGFAGMALAIATGLHRLFGRASAVAKPSRAEGERA